MPSLIEHVFLALDMVLRVSSGFAGQKIWGQVLGGETPASQVTAGPGQLQPALLPALP